MEPHETHRRSPRSAAPRRKATGQDRGAARCDQAHATIGPVILPSTHCRLYYRLLSNERLDLMIDGKSRSELELYRTTLMENGLSVDAIAQDQFFGHDYFQLVDPDGNGITVYTSHTEEFYLPPP